MIRRTRRSAMRTPRTRRGEVHPPPFQSFPFFSKTTRQLWTRSIAQREGATREAFFFFLFPFSLRNERNVRWHPVSESFAVPLTNGSGFSDDWAIVFGWAGFHPHFRRPFAMAVAYCFLLLLLFSSFLLSRLAPAWSETNRSEACRVALVERAMCLQQGVFVCVVPRSAVARESAYCVLHESGGWWYRVCGGAGSR